MKKLLSILTVMLVAVVLLSACKKEDDRDQFIGTFKMIEKCPYWEDQYSVTITTSSANKSDVLINGLFGISGLSCPATINGTNMNISLYIYSGMSFSGSARLNGIYLDMALQVTHPEYGVFNVTISGTKL